MRIMRLLFILGLLFIGTNAFAVDGDLIVNGQVGVGTTTPASKLDVNGDVRVGNSSASCTSSIEGAIRYNATSKAMEYCNGTTWAEISGTGSATNTAKAWVNFNGASCPSNSCTIRKSYNVSSVTRNATGDYTVNFTNSMADANYAITTSAGRTSATSNTYWATIKADSSPLTTGSVRVQTGSPMVSGTHNEALIDADIVTVLVFD
jgi:hypothetical protein